MNKTPKQLFTILFSLTLFISACGAGDLYSKAEETSKAYYAKLQKKEYDSALVFCSKRAFEASTKDQWRTALERNAGLLGDLKSFKKTSDFNIATSTSSGTTVIMTYDVEWQYG